MSNIPTNRSIRQLANSIRAGALRMVHKANASHIGSCLSMAALLAVVYGRVLRVDPFQADWPNRDRFILSKGHGAAALYAVLAERGFFPKEWLDTYCQDGSRLVGHITHHGVPGIEVSTGSLGHGLSIGCGLALAGKRDRCVYRIFVLLSDGECDEGSTWEAALFAPHQKLDNLVVIVDNNKIQSFGPVKEVLDLEPLADKWRSFRWAVREIDGQNHDQIQEVLSCVPFEPAKPSVIIPHTVKGKGVSFMEGQLAWHYKSPNDEQLVQALETTYDANIGVQGNFLFGDTAETLGTAAETFELWLKLRKHNIWMVPVEVYPGTQLYLQAVSTGLIKDKLKFIERGCPSVNLTQMSEKDYLQVLFLMHLLRNSYQIIPAQMVDCKQDGSHPLRGTLYVVTVKCPHCHHTVEYRNMSLNGYRKLGCRECNRRLDLPPLDQYSVWPPNYKLASEYSFSESHAEEIRQFLNSGNRSWLVAEGVALEGSTARFNIIRFFGKHYLVPQSLSPDDIRGHRVSIFTVDINSGEVRQCLDV